MLKDFFSDITAGGLLNFAGSWLSGRSRRKEAAANRRMAQEQFDAQMDQTIQRRVKDAQAAGIHPLFALGGSASASPTISVGNAPTGSAMGDGLKALAESMGITAKNRSEARLDEAQAAYYDALTAKATSDAMSTGRDTLGAGDQVPRLDLTSSPAGVSPLANSPDIGVAGDRAIPQHIDVQRPDGRSVRIPNPELGLDEVAQLEYIRQNTVMGLADQIEGFVDYVRGRVPNALNRQRIRYYERELARLTAIRNNPERAAEAERLWRDAWRWVQTTVRRWTN